MTFDLETRITSAIQIPNELKINGKMSCSKDLYQNETNPEWREYIINYFVAKMYLSILFSDHILFLV